MKLQQINLNYRPIIKKDSNNFENKQVSTPQIHHNATNQLYFNPAYCISFSGACVDLAKAMKTLKATEILKDDSRLPKRVEDLANRLLKNGNPQNLTLIDVHKQAYFDIMYSKSLDEIKDRFSEFSKILSVDELGTKPQNGSFLRDVLDGKNEYFSKDKDISLELMKMYWGEGFSLSDLEKHTGIKATTFASVMKILNIPLRNKHYANVLKHSDPDASKRIADMIAATKDANFEKTNGYISVPRGYLPVSRCQKILDSLFEYYEKDPSRIYDQPKIIKNFYKDNVFANEVYNATLFEMWNFGSMKNIKRNILKFFDKKSGTTNYSMKELNGYNSLSETENMWIKEYFAKNKSDKDTFSRSLRSAYKHTKTRLEAEKTKKTEIVLYPKKIQDSIYKYYDDIGRDKSEFIPNLLKVEDSRAYSIPICGRLSIHEVLKNNRNTDAAYVNSLYNTFNTAYNMLYFEKSPTCTEIKNLIMRTLTHNELFGLDSNTAMNVYLDICNKLTKAKRDDLVLAISRYLENN